MDKVRCNSGEGDKRIIKELTVILFDSKDGVAYEATRQMKILWENLDMKCLSPLQLCYILGADPTGLEESVRSNQFSNNHHLIYFLHEIKRLWKMERGGKHLINGDNCSTPSKIFVVALDGGGIRGLITAMILRFVSWRIFGCEDGMKRKFQWFTGTSTGGIIALALTKSQELTPTECVQLFWKHKSDVLVSSKLSSVVRTPFQQSSSQQKRALKSALKNYFKEECLEKYSEKASPRVSVTTLNITKTSLELPAITSLELLRNYDIQVDGDHIDNNQRLWSLTEMALATSGAAPAYFGIFQNDNELYADSKLSVNCPLNALFADIDRLYKYKQQPKAIGGILSIGIGSKTRENRPEGKTKKQLGFRSISDLLQDQATGAHQNMIKFTEARCRSADIEFLRLCPENGDVQLDPQDDRKLLSIMMDTLVYLSKNLDKIDKFAQVYKECLTTTDETDHLSWRNDSLQEESIKTNFLDQAADWLDQMYPKWKETICANFNSRTQTICSTNILDDTLQEEKIFLKSLLKLKLGGLLINAFETHSFIKTVNNFEDIQREEKQEEKEKDLEKRYFMLIHQQLGIIIFDSNKKSEEHFRMAGEQLKEQITGLEIFYRHISDEIHSSLKIRGILCVPDDYISSKADFKNNYDCELVNESLLNDKENFKEFLNNMNTIPLAITNTSIKFIAALFTYRQAKPIYMSSNALEIYRRLEENEKRQTNAKLPKIKEEKKSHQDTDNVSPQADISSQGDVGLHERETASDIAEPIAIMEPEDEQISLAKIVSQGEANPAMIATPEQQKAIESKAKRIVISGPPGTGKTHCLFLRALNAAKRKGLGRVILSTTSAQELTAKFERFYSKNKEGMIREIEIEMEGNKPIRDKYSSEDDLFFDESIIWDSYVSKEKVTADFHYLCQSETTTGSITIVGWIPAKEIAEAKESFPTFEFHHLKTIMRGTKNIINECKYFLNDPKIRVIHNFAGEPIERYKAAGIDEMFRLLVSKIKSLLPPPSKMNAKTENRCTPADVAVIIGSKSVPKNGDVFDIKNYLRQHGISCGSCGEQIKDSRLLAVSNTEDSRSYDWPVVIVIVYSDRKSDYMKAPSYIHGVSRAIAKLFVVECTTGEPSSSFLFEMDHIKNEIGQIAYSAEYDDKKRVSEVHRAAFCGDYDILEQLLKGQSKLVTDYAGRTPLHYVACSQADDNKAVKIIHALRNANYSAMHRSERQSDRTQRSPLHFAAVSGRPVLVCAMTIANEQFDQLNTLLNDPKHSDLYEFACDELHQDCCDQLGRTPLHYVSQGPDTEESAKIVHILLGNVGCDGDMQEKAIKLDIDYASALHLAVSDENPSVVETLLTYPFFGRQINVPDATGRTPIYYAYKNEKIWKMLENAGAITDDHVKLNDGSTPKFGQWK